MKAEPPSDRKTERSIIRPREGCEPKSEEYTGVAGESKEMEGDEEQWERNHFGNERSLQGAEEDEEEGTSLSQQAAGDKQEDPIDSEDGEKPVKVRVNTKVTKEERES